MSAHVCARCGYSEPPPEPPLGSWVRDRFGGVSQRRVDADGRDGWGQPGMLSGGKWEAMWEARGPLEPCGPWGAVLEAWA